MIGRVTLLIIIFILFGCSAGTPAVAPVHAPVEFIQPKSLVKIGHPYGTTEVPVQVRVERHPDNRVLEIDYCMGREFRQVDGEYAEQVFPAMRPLIVHLPQGECDIVARVLDASGRVRHFATITFTVR